MRKITTFLLSVALTVVSVSFVGIGQASAAEPTAKVGKSLYAAGGKRIGAIYRTTADGSAQIILNGKMITVPAATISLNNGRLETNLDKKTVLASR